MCDQVDSSEVVTLAQKCKKYEAKLRDAKTKLEEERRAHISSLESVQELKEADFVWQASLDEAQQALEEHK